MTFFEIGIFSCESLTLQHDFSSRKCLKEVIKTGELGSMSFTVYVLLREPIFIFKDSRCTLYSPFNQLEVPVSALILDNLTYPSLAYREMTMENI